MELRKKVLVLGADEAGQAVAGRYLKDEDQVLLCDTCKDKLDAAKTALKDVDVLEITAGTPEEVNAAIDAAAVKLGGIDVFVYAVSDHEYVPFEGLDYAQWLAVRERTLNPAFMWGQGMGRKMRDQGKGGFIVYLMDSLCAWQDADDVAHCAMEWGMKGMIRCMAVTLGHFGITTNAVCASALDTAEAEARRFQLAEACDVPAADVRKDLIEGTLTGRMQTAEDVAEMCRFLTTEGININGQAVQVNGGTCFN